MNRLPRPGTLLWAALGLLCILYGGFVRAVGSGTAFFLVWITLGLLFCGFGAAAQLRLWGRLPVLLRRGILLLAAGGLLCFAGVEGLILYHFPDEAPPDTDYVLVLGAQVYANGPSTVLRYRLDTAADYLRENPRTRCIVSGGQGWNEPFTEARGMADYLIGQGIPAERILLEEQADNTVQNILYSRPLMDDPSASVAVVTNNFHMFRGLQLAGKQGMAHACGLSAPSTPLYLPNNMLREFFGVVKDALAGNLI